MTIFILPFVPLSRLTENYEYKTPPNDFKKWSSRDLYNVYITAKIEQHTHLSKVSFGQLVKQVRQVVFKIGCMLV